MPLTDYQASPVRSLTENWTFDSYLTGGTAILIEPFVTSRPPEEIGYLYYSPSRQEFVDPQTVSDAVPHFGRPGGVVPQIVE